MLLKVVEISVWLVMGLFRGMLTLLVVAVSTFSICQVILVILSVSMIRLLAQLGMWCWGIMQVFPLKLNRWGALRQGISLLLDQIPL